MGDELKATRAAERRERLSTALRANLRRRKLQARGRDADAQMPADEAPARAAGDDPKTR